MGLKCSLVGHSFGEPEREQEREERGDEVVLTIREVKSCNRCGTERVVSESTEVRPIRPDPRTDEDAAEAEDPESAAASEPPAATATGDDPESHPEDAEPATDPETDDAVILTESDDEEAAPEPDREEGEWPEADDTRLEEAEQDSEADTDQPADADAPADTPAADAEPTEAEAEALDSEEWPDPRDEDEGFDATAPTEDRSEEAVVEAAEAPEAGFVAADEGGTGGSSGVFVCPSCGFEEAAAGSSLRGGDICPECKRGYLAERSA